MPADSPREYVALLRRCRTTSRARCISRVLRSRDQAQLRDDGGAVQHDRGVRRTRSRSEKRCTSAKPICSRGYVIRRSLADASQRGDRADARAHEGLRHASSSGAVARTCSTVSIGRRYVRRRATKSSRNRALPWSRPANTTKWKAPLLGPAHAHPCPGQCAHHRLTEVFHRVHRVAVVRAATAAPATAPIQSTPSVRTGVNAGWRPRPEPERARLA